MPIEEMRNRLCEIREIGGLVGLRSQGFGRSQTWPPIRPLVISPAQVFDVTVKPILVQNGVQSVIERIRRRLDHIARRYPQFLLPFALLAAAHRHISILRSTTFHVQNDLLLPRTARGATLYARARSLMPFRRVAHSLATSVPYFPLATTWLILRPSSTTRST